VTIPFVSIGPDWHGATAVYLGSGPSLAAVDTTLLGGFRTIVQNDSVHKLPDACTYLLCDRHWLDKHPDFADYYKGPEIITLRPDHVTRPDPRLVAMKRGPHAGLSERATELNGNHTSLTHAICLAVLRGVTRILLVGVDLKPGPDGRRHYHDGEIDRPDAIETRYPAHARTLATQVDPLAARGIAVINCNPDSGLDLWPRMSLAEAVGVARAA